MIVTGSRLRQIGWLVVLTVCLAAFLALGFKVRAVVSEVRLAERKIVALEKDKIILETEFQARANQQQLANWNAVDFGFKAPVAEQFVEGQHQLSDYGSPRGANAPDPIRVALAPDEANERIFPAMVSPIPSEQVSAETTEIESPKPDEVSDDRSLAERMALSDMIPASPSAPPADEPSE